MGSIGWKGWAVLGAILLLQPVPVVLSKPLPDKHTDELPPHIIFMVSENILHSSFTLTFACILIYAICFQINTCSLTIPL